MAPESIVIAFYWLLNTIILISAIICVKSYWEVSTWVTVGGQYLGQIFLGGQHLCQVLLCHYLGQVLLGGQYLCHCMLEVNICPDGHLKICVTNTLTSGFVFYEQSTCRICVFATVLLPTIACSVIESEHAQQLHVV